MTKMNKLIRIKSFNNLYKQGKKDLCLFSNTRAVTRDKNQGGLYCTVSMEAQRGNELEKTHESSKSAAKADIECSELFRKRAWKFH